MDKAPVDDDEMNCLRLDPQASKQFGKTRVVAEVEIDRISGAQVGLRLSERSIEADLDLHGAFSASDSDLLEPGAGFRALKFAPAAGGGEKYHL